MTTTFAFVTFAWIFFRADGMDMALNYVKHISESVISHPNQLLMISGNKMAFIYIAPIILGDWYLRHNERQLVFSQNKVLRFSIYLILLFLILVKFESKTSFIYFQF